MIKNIFTIPFFTIPFFNKSLCGLLSIALLAAASMAARVAEADEFSLGLLYSDRYSFRFLKVRNQTGSTNTDVYEDAFYTPLVGFNLTYEQQAPGSSWSQLFDLSFNTARRSISGLYHNSSTDRKELLAVGSQIKPFGTALRDAQNPLGTHILTKATATATSFNISYLNKYDFELFSTGGIDFILSPSFGAYYSYISEKYDLGSFDQARFYAQSLGTLGVMESQVVINFEGGSQLVYESFLDLANLFMTSLPGINVSTNGFEIESKNNRFYYNPSQKVSNDKFNFSGAPGLYANEMLTYKMNNGLNLSIGTTQRQTTISEDITLKISFEY